MSETETKPHIGPYPNTPSGLKGILRRGAVLFGAWAFLAVALTVTTVFALVTFRIGLSRYMYKISRFCGRTVLRISGVHVRVINPERLSGQKARIVAFNHTSQLDLFVFASLLPPGGTGLAKREFVLVPFIGWALFAFDFLLINRSHPEKAKRSLVKAARRLRERRATVFYSPEGTRSRDGRLGSFKMGLLHLVAASHAPIVPVVVRGAKECQPMGSHVPQSGVVEIEILPEVDTSDFDADNLHAKRDELRAIFVVALDETA